MARGMDFFRIPLKKSDEKKEAHSQFHAPAGKFLRHAIFGMNDGIVSTLALLAGLIGAYMDKSVIIIAGMAEMFAGAISMSLGTYISTKSQTEFYKREIKRESEDLDKLPKIERSRVRDIYRKKGFEGKELDKIVDKLTSDRELWLDVLVSEELGLKKSKMENALIAGVVMFVAFVFGAFIPLSSFMFVPTEFALKTAVVSSLAILFFAGAGKTHFTGRNWFKSGIEMVVVGAVATFAAFYIGSFIGNYISYLV